jgi:hypothetical protein
VFCAIGTDIAPYPKIIARITGRSIPWKEVFELLHTFLNKVRSPFYEA